MLNLALSYLTVVIDLPIAAEADAAGLEKERTQESRPGSGSGPTGRRILVVDDEEWIRSLCGQLLRGQGHAVASVASGESALEALRTQQFDVIVCDWKMPGMSGIHFYEHLISTGSAMADKVYFMTGDVINENFQEFLKRHGKSCLPKPFSLGDFQSAVDGMLGLRVQ